MSSLVRIYFKFLVLLEYRLVGPSSSLFSACYYYCYSLHSPGTMARGIPKGPEFTSS